MKNEKTFRALLLASSIIEHIATDYKSATGIHADYTKADSDAIAAAIDDEAREGNCCGSCHKTVLMLLDSPRCSTCGKKVSL